MKCIATPMVAVVFVLAFGLRGAALHDGPHVGPDDEVFNVGKNGEVKIAMDVIIGDVLVKKGKYLLEHRVDADGHTLALTRLESKPGTEASVHRIRMRWIPSEDAVKQSALFAARQRDRSYRVTVIQTAGESGDHVPEDKGKTETQP